jgi:hypothetical protein
VEFRLAPKVDRGPEEDREHDHVRYRTEQTRLRLLDPACFDEDWEALDPATKARSASLASQSLHRLTGYRVGGCPITVRPCTKGCIDSFVPFHGGYGGYGFQPGINTQGNWVNSCGCTHDCSCTALCEVHLPGPVGEVYEVKVDGTPVPSTDYRG